MSATLTSASVIETVSVSVAPTATHVTPVATQIVEQLTNDEVSQFHVALESRNVDDFASSILNNEKVLRAIRQNIISQRDKDKGKEMLAVIEVEQNTQSVLTKGQVMSVGEQQIDLADMITKDGKLRKKKPKKQMTPEEIKEKLRKLRESRDDIPMKTCDVCGYRTREPYKMRRHERTHTGEKPFKCPLCPFRGAEKSVVVKHLKSNVHSKKSHQLSGLRGGLAGGMGIRIDCDQCSFTASSSQQMIKHKQSRHEGPIRRVGKLQCPYCDYRNSYQKVMDLHIKAHEEEGTNTPNTNRKSQSDDMDEDGVVTVFLEDFMPPSVSNDKPAASAVSHSADDGVDDLLTSMNA